LGVEWRAGIAARRSACPCAVLAATTVPADRANADIAADFSARERRRLHPTPVCGLPYFGARAGEVTEEAANLAAATDAEADLALGNPASARAQHAPFKSGTDMVPLTVTVTDRAGKHVTGPTGGDFTVFEDGVQQPLSFFAGEDVPLDVALVIDASSSMRADLPLVQKAASGLIRTLRSFDRGAVVEVRSSEGCAWLRRARNGHASGLRDADCCARGSRAFFPKSAVELLTIYDAISQELASQYELGYVPIKPAGDGGFRRVFVRLAPRTNASARTRSGYYADRIRGSRFDLAARTSGEPR
jgi:hypothetical protein